jgi:hypothetical protein
MRQNYFPLQYVRWCRELVARKCKFELCSNYFIITGGVELACDVLS